MTVKELLKVQKYYIPVRIVGYDTKDNFFSDRFKHMELEKIIEKYGDKEVTYFYHEPKYKKNGKMARLYKYVLVIETKHVLNNN